MKMAGVARSPEFNAASRTFESSIRTFRTLSSEEADRIQPSRVGFYVARNGDTWDSIARTAGGGVTKPSTLES